MRKTSTRILGLALALAVLLGLLPGAAMATGGALEGLGTEESPYLIADASDLAAFRDLVNGTPSSAAWAKLTGDIDLGGEAWDPIAPTSGYVTDAYAGTFDGDGHTISGLSVSSTKTSQALGLFGVVNGATIRNLKVEGTVTSNGNYNGGIVGKSQGAVTVQNCSFDGQVSGNYAGGIVGRINAGSVNIDRCANLADITGTYAAGILGYGTARDISEISNCYNTGTITGSTRAGGIAGQIHNNTLISNCYNVGALAGTASTKGGVCAFNNQSVTNCFYLDGNVETPQGSKPSAEGAISQIESPEALLEKLGDAFAADENRVNDGWPILTWQAGAAPAPKDPHLEVTGPAALYMVNSGPQPTATLTARQVDMEATPVVWSLLRGQDVVSLTYPEGAGPNHESVILQALAPGYATVQAQAGGCTAQAEIAVYPYVTTGEIAGTVAAGRTVRAQVNVLGGGEYDYEAFPALQFQWRVLSGEDYSSGNTANYQDIPGATGQTYAIPAELAGDYLSFRASYGGESVTPNRTYPVATAARGALLDDSAALDLPGELWEATVLVLPSVGAAGSAIAWESDRPDLIDPATGAVTLPQPGEDDATVTLTATLTFGGEQTTRTFSLLLHARPRGPQDDLADAAAALGAWYKLCPVYGVDDDVTTMLARDLADQGFEGIGVAVKAVEEVYGGAAISPDGGLTYFYADPNTTPAVPMGSFQVTFTLSKGGASLDYGPVSVLVPWDVERVQETMRAEILDKVALENTPVTADLSLPRVVDGKRWTLIAWTSSDLAAISVSGRDQSTADTLFDPYVGVVTPGETDKTVTLTAAFTFQLTGDVTGREEPIVLYKVFPVTVPALEKIQADRVRQGLLDKLDRGFAAKGLTDAVTGARLEPDGDGIYAVTHDVQLPTTGDFGVDGKDYPVTITSDNEAVVQAPGVRNAARVTVLRPGVGRPDGLATVTVTLADRGTDLTASRSFTLRVPALTQAEVDGELALMARVRAAYFDGIRGENAARDDVRTDLAPFLEVYEDESGALVWVRDSREQTGRGIVPTPIEGWEDLELWRLFKSSNPNVVSHETLRVTRQEQAKAVTVTSYLSSETLGRYGELYQRDPDAYAQYADLAGLYYQEVTTDAAVPAEVSSAAAALSQTGAMVVRGLSDPDSAVPVAETLNVSFVLTGLDGQVWIPAAAYTGLDEASTVYDLFTRALTDHGCTAVRERGTYIVSVSGAPGALAEKQYGPRSGWMYRVNGAIPQVYMGACPLHDGDKVQVFYTRDASVDDPDWTWPTDDPADEPGDEPGDDPGNVPGDNPGNVPGDNPGDVPGDDPGGNPGDVPGDDPSDNPGHDPGDTPGDDPGGVPGGNPGDVPSDDPADDPSDNPGGDPADDPTDDPGDDPTDDPADVPSTPGQSHSSGSSHRRDEAASQDEAQGATPGQGETPAARDFADVAAGSWYEGGVSFVVERGLFQGVAEGRFAPEVPMTRAMLMTVLARLDGQDTASGGVWYQVGVDWAVAAGVSDGAAPDALVTREQLAVMLYRYAQRLGLPTAGRDSLRAFADGGQIAPWAQDAMAWAVDQGILNGRSGGVLDPAASATRAEAATMLQRFAALLPE